MSKNILIRNLTEKQNERLLLLQRKFGVKTNTQALLLLLQYCVILDDELETLMEWYKILSIMCSKVINELSKNNLDFSEVEKLLRFSMDKFCKYEWLLKHKK